MQILKFLKKKSIRTKYGSVILRRFYGVKGAQIIGAVHAPSRPFQRFHVALLDGEGSVILTVYADKSHHKPPIPAGYGFEIPLSALSAGIWPEEKRIQLKVIETGEIFPEEARKLPDEKGSKIEYHLRKLSGVVDRQTLVAGTHEATQTEVPLILLEILRQFKERHGFKVVLLNMKEEGALTGEFQKHCVDIIDDFKSLLETAPEETAELLAMLQKNAYPVAIINSLWSTILVQECKKTGFGVISLVHEYPIGLSIEQIQAHFGESDTVIFPSADLRRSYEEHPNGVNLLMKSTPSSVVLPPGCHLLEGPVANDEEMKLLQEKLRTKCKLRPDGRVVLCCGTVDLRMGFDWLISLIIAYNRKSFAPRKTHFLWVGRTHIPQLLWFAKQDLGNAGVMNRFHPIRELEYTRAAFCLADLFLHCSRADPFPGAVLESFLHGIPVIGFDYRQGSTDMIRETRFGTVVPYLDTDATVHAIDEILEGTIIRSRVRRKGPDFVRKNFRYSDYVDEIARLIGHEGPRKAQKETERRGAVYHRKSETLGHEREKGVAQISEHPPVMVLGFHRSGTSFLAHWLHSVGVKMNPTGEFYGKDKGNPEGHYEDLGFLRLHAEIMLAQNGEFMRRWGRVWGGALCPFLPRYEVGWQEYLDDARELMGGLGSLEPWGWKDPRTLLFLDMWNAVFPNAFRVLAIRHPLEILYSLVRRGTDLLVKDHPLMVFEAIAGYHKPVVNFYTQNPEAIHVISMPPDVGKLETLCALISERLEVKLRPPQQGWNFDPQQFRSLRISEKVAAEFRSIFPHAAAPYDTFSGMKELPPTGTLASLSDDEKLDWLDGAFLEMTNGQFRLFRELQRMGVE